MPASRSSSTRVSCAASATTQRRPASASTRRSAPRALWQAADATPAVGFATGLERVLLALEKQGLIPEQEKKADAFVVALGEAAKAPAFTLLTKLRRADLKASMDYAGRSMKAQMKQANKAHARFALIIGEDEVKESCVMLKDMEKSEQQKVSFDVIIEKLCAEVKG